VLLWEALFDACIAQLHALARDVFYGKRGRINARELQDQMNSCSCLTLIVACIVYWQAKEIAGS
jgi:TnpA family transposase